MSLPVSESVSVHMTRKKSTQVTKEYYRVLTVNFTPNSNMALRNSSVTISSLHAGGKSGEVSHSLQNISGASE